MRSVKGWLGEGTRFTGMELDGSLRNDEIYGHAQDNGR